MDIGDNIAQGFRAEMVGRILYFGTSGATLLFLARALDPGVYGLFFLALSILTGAQLLADLGVPYSAATYIAEYGESNPERLGPIVGFSFRFILVSSTVVALAIAVFHAPLASVFDDPGLGTLLLVGSAVIVVRALYRYFRKLLQGFKRIDRSAAVYASEGVGRFGFVVVFVLLGFGGVGAMAGYIVGFGLAAVVGVVLFYRSVYRGLDTDGDLDAETRTDVLRYSVPLFATRGAKVVDNTLDTALVGFFLAPVAVGYYALSKQAVHLLQAPASALGFSVGPYFGDRKAADQLDRVSDIYRSTLVHTLLLYVPATAGLILLARPMITIVFGPEYAPATDVLQIFALVAGLQAIEEVSENALDFLGRARARSIAKGSTALANVALIVVLVPALGVVGAAIAKAVTHTAYALTTVYVMHTEISIEVRTVARDFVLILGITGAMSAVVVQSAAFVSGFVTLAGVVLLGGAVWAALAILLGLLDVRTVGSYIT
ncbi:flippase [Halorussus amylolyticus]|uniref:flippase n=1 Tax=Halorussus amylolyticus TaxID=1126242 RepID=UPI00105132E8|nr:flippase [Halorussus amylolyticus]